MRFDIRGRGEGKTTDLLHMLIEDPKAILVVHSEQERGRLLKKLLPLVVELKGSQAQRAQEDRAKRIITYADLLRRGLYGQPHDRHILIDNVDILLQQLVGAHTVTYVTATKED
jgi:hypothetical protein